MNPDTQRLQFMLQQLGYLTATSRRASWTERRGTQHDASSWFAVSRRAASSTSRRIAQIVRALDERELVVFGLVVDGDGPLPEVGVMVQDRDRDEPPWQLLGEDVTGGDGRFLIWYRLDQFDVRRTSLDDYLAANGDAVLTAAQVPLDEFTAWAAGHLQGEAWDRSRPRAACGSCRTRCSIPGP